MGFCLAFSVLIWALVLLGRASVDVDATVDTKILHDLSIIEILEYHAVRNSQGRRNSALCRNSVSKTPSFLEPPHVDTMPLGEEPHNCKPFRSSGIQGLG